VDDCEQHRFHGLLKFLHDRSGAGFERAIVTSAGDGGARGGVFGGLGWVGWLPCPFVGNVISYLNLDTDFVPQLIYGIGAGFLRCEVDRALWDVGGPRCEEGVDLAPAFAVV
jgi:hypothetical protein